MDALSRQRVLLVRKRSGEKSDENIVFFLAADAGNVGQEDPTVWIGYMCMIAISFSHSRTTFLREFLQTSYWPSCILLSDKISGS